MFCQSHLSQEQHLPFLDSLENLDIKELTNKFNKKIKTSKEEANIYANLILQKHKNNGDKKGIVEGYTLMVRLHQNDLEKRIIYLDSAISLSKNSKNIYYPTILFVYKGVIYADNGIFNKSLNSYLKALESAKEKKDLVYEYIIYHNIALLKRRIGKYDEAKILFKKCLIYEKSRLDKSKNVSNSYLETLTELVTTHRRNKEIDSALILNKEGLAISNQRKIHCLFKLNEGILNYYNNNYVKAVNDIKIALNELYKPENDSYSEYYNLIDGYFFLGKSYEAIKERNTAIKYYKKVDSLVSSTNYLVPEIRSSYATIIDYYKSEKDVEKQLHYIRRLIKYDSILDHNLVDLNVSLSKDYDTPNLLMEKERLINSLRTRNKESNVHLKISIISIIIIFTLFLFNYKRKKKYKLRFEELMNKNQRKEPINIGQENELEELSLDISKILINKILKGLDEFESNNGFTQVNLTSNLLAKQLQTNSKYLTKVIKYYKQKNFSPYINDLRIEYIINRIKTEQKLQNYTIKALSKEAGFNSTEVFSKYFYKKTGIYPSYFIKKIQNTDNK
ncbi:AraC family transcriptional regulator [Aquimarina sp. MMG015]|uniref:AraC family transcriptional regulator n=1 Tax=Aquimarina sp. MMG015 TaxID=2822689 RepID=UPI001B39F8CD|nr:AraC family transcriptional regulator [Aquimarina sp. MMG015]